MRAESSLIRVRSYWQSGTSSFSLLIPSNIEYVDPCIVRLARAGGWLAGLRVGICAQP